MNVQFLFAAGKGSLNIHDLGSTQFLCLRYSLFADYVEAEVSVKCLTCAVCSCNSLYISVSDFPELIV